MSQWPARVLLATTSVLLATTVVLATLYFGRARTLRELEGRLLAEEVLQQKLASMTSSDLAIVPHFDPEIGFVLDRAKEQATWRAGAGNSYSINSIGLRGPEIGNKEAGVLRVLLLGDSVIFGWRIADEHRIGESMARVIDAGLGAGRVEVISAALPAWNLRSEAAFLRRYLHRLQPDVVLWNLLRNDIQDMPAAVPPGVLGRYVSPQAAGETPFTCLADYQYELPLPSIIARWQDNLRQISSFSRDYQVPGLLLSWMPATRAHIEYLLRSSQFELPVVHLPAYYRDHERWPIEPADPHPTPWATHSIAIGLVAELMRLELIPSFELVPSDQEIAARWRSEAAVVPSEADTTELLQDRLAMVPGRIEPGKATGTAGIVFGVHDGWMAANGLLCLRGTSSATSLILELTVPPGEKSPHRQAVFTVRNLEGEQRFLRVDVPDGHSRHVLQVPPSSGPDHVWELEWSFDWSFCRNHRDCVSARLLFAGVKR